MEIKYLNVIREVLKNDSIQLSNKIETDSILFVSIIVELEKESGKEISIDKIYADSYETYKDLIAVFER